MAGNKPQVSYITVDDEFTGQRLDNFLLRELKGVPRSLIYRIVRRGEVRVNDGRSKAGTRLRGGDRVRVPPLRTSKPPGGYTAKRSLAVNVLFEDDCLLVIDKPSGMAVHAGTGVREGMIEILRGNRPDEKCLELVHRLDRETSGCLLIARRRSALRRLHEALRVNAAEGGFIKRYQALVAGIWDARDGSVEIPLRKYAHRGGERLVVASADGRYARSRFRVLKQFEDCTLLDVTLVTGRTHQVRVHAAARGHPVIGDVKYGDKTANLRFSDFGLKRLFLHATELGFAHPVTGERITVQSPLPPELKRVLCRLERRQTIVDNRVS